MKYNITNLRLIILTLSFFAQFASATTLNGFDLSNSTIPVNQILSGGPPRDGIPSLDDPKFVSSDQAHFLKPHDRIIGVFLNGEARAYPTKILNWHEIVNDVFKDKALSVTYCPLCGTGIVYASDIIIGKKTKRYQFGVSGLLYNSDVLLFDRQTETLWSQILSRAISGPLVNTKLQILPSSHTSWKAWKKKYPNSKVLSTNTGFSRNYQRSPYGDYDNNKSLYFQVAAQSKKYHPKERVLGISINGQHKSYPFIELARHRKSPLMDSFAGKQLLISFDSENRDGTIKDINGNILPSVNSFWFAWYAFHPDTKIYTAK